MFDKDLFEEVTENINGQNPKLLDTAKRFFRCKRCQSLLFERELEHHECSSSDTLKRVVFSNASTEGSLASLPKKQMT